MSELEQRLFALGGALEVPPGPDLAATLPARLPERGARRGPVLFGAQARSLALALGALLLATGVAMAVTPSRDAILRALGLRGVRIERVTRLPGSARRPAHTGSAGTRLGLGTQIPFASARHAAGFTALLPPRPVPVYLAHDVPGGRISLRIGSAIVTEFRGTSLPFVFKTLGPNTRVTHVRVDGSPGVFLSGAPHQVLFQTSRGLLQSAPVRLAGDVLLWQHGPVSLRLEGVHSQRQALTIAGSLTTAPPAVRAAPTSAPVAADGRGCPVSTPSGPKPPRIALLNLGNPIAKASSPGWYGNGALWTQLPLGPPIRLNGKLTMKIGWFHSLPGRVTLTGHRLHGSAPFRAGVGTPAEYGRTGFVVSGVAFGAPGCWVLHARVRASVLTVVIDVQHPR